MEREGLERCNVELYGVINIAWVISLVTKQQFQTFLGRVLSCDLNVEPWTFMNKESVHAMIKLADNHSEVSAGAKNGENKNKQGQVRDLWNDCTELYLIYFNVSCCYLAWQPQLRFKWHLLFITLTLKVRELTQYLCRLKGIIETWTKIID